MYINATVENIGTFPEIFNVTAIWQGIYTIGNMVNISFDPDVSKNASFVWNTDVTSPPWQFPLDGSGRLTNSTVGDIRVLANVVPYEKGLDYDYTLDNSMTDGQVRLTGHQRMISLS